VIRHRPAGRGHPYRHEPDQRVPVRPLAGEAFALRATTSGAADRVVLELERERGGPRTEVVMRRTGAAAATPIDGYGAPGAGAAEGTHLAAAAARAGVGRGRLGWVAEVPGLAHGERLRYRFVGDGGRTRWFAVGAWSWEPDGGVLALEGEPAERVVPGTTSWLVGEEGVARARFALRLEDGEHVTGFGERFDALDQRGRRVDAVVFEQYKAQGGRTYLPMPFALVLGAGREEGWGLHVDTTRRTWFDVGASEPDRLWVEVDLEPGEDPRVVLALFAGRPEEVLGGFLERTAAPALPPDWVFEPWISANEWNTQARVMAEVERSAAEGIPVGVVVIEAWSDESTFVAFRDAQHAVHPDGAPHRLADFTFPPDGAWPDPKGMVDELHRRGIRLLLWQIPLQKTAPAPTGQARADRDTMLARGYAVRRADGRPYRNRGWWFPGALLPDFTNPEATDWWLAKRRYLVEELGVDGFKTDGGEHAWGDDLRYADGTGGGETNQRFPVLYAQAYHRLVPHGTTFSRAGFTGAQAFPCHWAGDEDSTWDAFRASITAGLTAGMSGIFFWGWDLAGFSGPVPDAELYLRAAAMAALCPIFQYHAEHNHHRRPSGDRTPWNIAERTGDARVLPAFRRFARLRTRLAPYLGAARPARADAIVQLVGLGDQQGGRPGDVGLDASVVVGISIGSPSASASRIQTPGST